MLCRLCLKDSECCLQIFDVNGKQLGIAEILKMHFWFQPLPTDSISTAICRICWLKVSDFHQFYLMVEQAHTLFKRTDVKHEAVNLGEQDFFESCVEIKEEEFLEETHQAKQVEEAVNPLDEPEFVNTKREEPEENGMKSDYVQEESNSASELAETTQSAKKSARKRKCARRTLTAKKVVVEDDNDDSDFENGDEDDEQEKPKRGVKVIKSVTEDEAMIKKHIGMGCDLCTYVGEDYSSICKHFRLQHPNIKPYVRCCEKKLNKRFKVVQHAFKHENPEFFKCQECLKIFSDRYTLKSHMITTHAPEEELTFACDQCPKKYSRKKLLDLHLPSHVPMSERTFICDQCPNSRFGSNHLLKIHISMRHRRAVNVCHVCAKEIRDKQSFEKHVRLHFEASGPRVKCPRPGCDSWLKDEENLRQHLRRHNDEGLTFTCDQCGRNCKNRRALRSHQLYVHSNEGFKCEECNKTFKKAITLREHMAQHTGESLYKCPFCTRTFNSNANMHSHKKKMHPVEWDIWRKTKQGSSQKLISQQQSTL